MESVPMARRASAREGDALQETINIELDAEGIVRGATGPTGPVLGCVAAAMVGQSMRTLVNSKDRNRLTQAFDRFRSDESTAAVSLAVRMVDGDGRSVWMELELHAPTGDGPSAALAVTARPYGQVMQRFGSDVPDPNPHHALVQESSDIVMVVDPEGTVRFANPAMLRLFGLEPDELLGTQVLDVIHPADHDTLTELVANLLERPDKTGGFEIRARHVDGSYRWIDGWLQNLLDHPDVGGLLGNGRDVTDRHLAQQALASSEERFRSLTSSSPSAIFELDDAARLQFANDRWVEVTGRTLGEVDDVFAVLHPEDVDRLRGGWASAGAPHGLEERVRVVRPDGDLRWVELRTRPVHDADGQITAHVGTLHDVTEIELAHRKLEHLASHDPLTGLPNRTLLLERLGLAVASARETGDSLALLFVDLDRFKVVNDSLGHHAGDRVLVEVAARLSDLVRPHDIVARFGGDEFVILCAPVTASDQAVNLADRIRRKVAGGVEVDGEQVHVSVSVGVVLGSGHTDPETMLRDADAAMYAAKTGGRDQARVFDATMHRDAMARLTIETGLRQGLEHGDFELYFQPIIDLASMRTTAVEALLRWRHPTRGLLEPDEFLDVAEESGLLADLSTWALATACEGAVDWVAPDGGEPPALFVNLAAVQLGDLRIVDMVSEVLARTGLDAGRVVLEVTERMLTTTPDATAAVLHALRDLGVRIAIDDFGTGYSSLSYLTRLPVDLLKIDCSFVAGLADHAADREVTAAIIAMAHALGLTAVAEGVETAEQLAVLRDLGCDTVQGFWYSRAVSADELRAVLAAGPRPG